MKLSVANGITSLLLLGSTQAANIVSQRGPPIYHHEEPSLHVPKGGNTAVFPILTRLRDSLVEFMFGVHPSKAQALVKAAATSPFQDIIRTRYADELVLRFNVTTTEEEASMAEAAARLFLDIWAFTDDFVDVRVHSSQVEPLLGLLPKSLRTAHSTLIPDLALAIYRSLPSTNGLDVISQNVPTWASLAKGRRSGDDNLFFQDYQPLPVVVRWMRLLEAMFPSFVKYVSVGKSFEGREIPALRVGLPVSANPDQPRKTIVITGGLHAREWISTSTVNYVAWSFITSFGKEPMITKFIDHFDIVFMPAVNPDGIEYTWESDRLWRKSRQQTNLRFCRGLDLDHAFGFGWDTSEAQSDPCSESYGGEKPFQAVEAMEIANWARNEVQNNNVKMVGLLDLHSYSQQVLFPYSYTCATEPPNLENLEELGAGLAKAIRLSNGESYSVASACEGAVAAAESERHPVWRRVESGGGSAIDWFYHELGAHFSYQIKLRDTGSYGFLLPKEYIVPTGEEMFDAMKYFGDYLLGNNGIEKTLQKIDEDNEPEKGEDETLSQELKRRRMRR